jgi:putative flippase GtrA
LKGFKLLLLLRRSYLVHFRRIASGYKLLDRTLSVYLCIGIVGIAVEYLVFLGLCSLSRDISLNHLFAMISAMSLNFFLHKKFTFQFRTNRFGGAVVFVRFMVAMAVIYLISLVVLRFFLEIFFFSEVVSKGIQLLLTTPMSYFMVKNLVFRE